MLDLKEEYATIVDVSTEGYIEIHQRYPNSEDALVLLSASQAKRLLDALPALIAKLEE